MTHMYVHSALGDMSVFTRAAPAMRGVLAVVVRLSVCLCLSVSVCLPCLSYAAFVSKRLTLESRKQHHVIDHGL